MSVGTATAIALASSAAASAYGAHAQASGAKKAAATQAAATDKATALQAQMANQAINAQNNIMYGGNGGTGGTGMPGQGGGGIAGMYAPYTNSAPATLSALHQYLGIPGAAQSQTAVPYGGYGQPMRPPMGQPQYGGGPMAGGYAMSMGAPGVPMPQPSQPMAPTGQPFRPRVGPMPAQGQIPMSALYRQG